MKHESPIGRRVKVDNYDTPAYYLPVSGTITRQINSVDGANNWFLLELDAPVQYQYKVGSGSFEFRGIETQKMLIRSRWKDYEIGQDEPTSVFILMIPDEALLEMEPTNVKDFIFDNWRMCSKEK